MDRGVDGIGFCLRGFEGICLGERLSVVRMDVARRGGGNVRGKSYHNNKQTNNKRFAELIYKRLSRNQLHVAGKLRVL